MSEPSPHQDGSGGVTFKLQLNCLARDTSETQLLRLPTFPTSVEEIKRAIQREFSIPHCVQTLSYNSIPLTGNENLLDAFRHIRSHDTLKVDYSSEAEVKKIDEVVNWVKAVMEALNREKTVPKNSTTSSAYSLIHKGAREKYDLLLALEIFDWMEAKAYVNKIYFMNCGGLEAVAVLYKYLLKHEWASMPDTLQYLEVFCSHAFANFGETLYLRRMLVKQDGLDMATRSLMRVRMQIEGDQVCDGLKSPEAGTSNYSHYALKRILENSLHTICNFSELPECQVLIASHPHVLDQALCISLSPTYRVSLSVLVSELFICLAHNPATHQFLAKPYIFRVLSEVCGKYERLGSSREDYLLSTALRCFTYMVYAQIAVVSSHLLPLEVVQSLTTCMQTFLSTAKPSDIMEYEEEQVCVWATLLPYLKLFYLPPTGDQGAWSPSCTPHLTCTPPSASGGMESATWLPSDEGRHPKCVGTGRCTLTQSRPPTGSNSTERDIFNPPSVTISTPCSTSPGPATRGESWLRCDAAVDAQAVNLLKQVSRSMALFFLHTKVSRECHCKILLEEQLVDFVTCLPWHVTPTSQEGAGQVVMELNSHLKLQPPRLFNLARAVLARRYFGLEKVIKAHSPMELARELLDTQLQ